MKGFQLVDTITPHKFTGQTAVCSITGISLCLDLPNINGTYLEYANPLSIYTNVVEIIKLPYKTHLSKYSIDILAGCLLTVVTKHKLIDDKLTAAHRNIILQTVPHFLLVDTIRFIVDLKERELKHLARFSLDSTLDAPVKEQATFHIIKDWLAESRAMIYPIASDRNTATEIDNAREYGVKLLQTKTMERLTNNVPIRIIMKDNKDAIKILIADGVKDSIFPRKILPLVKLLSIGDNLSNLSVDLRAKFTTKLNTIEHELIPQIVKIINHKVYTSAAKDVLDRYKLVKSGELGITNTITETSSYIPKRQSISEILEAKRKEFANNG